MHRDTEVYDKEKDRWSKARFSKIKAGDLFRLFEPDGTPVKDCRGSTEWIAKTDANQTESMGWNITIDLRSAA